MSYSIFTVKKFSELWPNMILLVYLSFYLQPNTPDGNISTALVLSLF